MAYTIGIGVLIDGEQFNKLRAIELRLADKTGNTEGLGQPPHVTVKRPFSVETVSAISQVAVIMKEVSANFHPFVLKLKTHANFDREVLYAQVEENHTLTKLHRDLLEALSPLLPKENPLEGPDMIFHSTLAMGLSDKEYGQAEAELQKIVPEPLVCPIEKVGLFLGLDNDEHWVVIDEVLLA